ncbi:Gfo/Idh/MocA family protein [Sphingomonas bacterium]|uniref:Gfo/Idh/MocA family protein n=1 Tax=Sphingomonas bacterium TaxID=1895847 RepID=UPI001576D77D|nr:Gfo/Idh/MocA family oxidoreductase [Sphingomonas bacterium]
MKQQSSMNGERIFNIAVVGLGKMGISHLSVANRTPGLKVTAICDSSQLVASMIEKYCRIPSHRNYDDLIRMPGLDAILISTPTRMHEQMIRSALECDLHVFCEKPMTLSAAVSADLAGEAVRRGLVTQVGYHNRSVGTFREAKRLIDAGAIGRLRHVHAEAYGPVVLKPSTKTWRSKANEGGGCLYDYAAHPANLMNWYAGDPAVCCGAQLTSQWSASVDDAVYADLAFQNGVSGQLSVNWADESARKMTTRITLAGDGGKIVADRQELQLFLGTNGVVQPGYPRGWTIKYITELTPHPSFYLRGEEYSDQLETFAAALAAGRSDPTADFASAAVTDRTLEMIRAASENRPAEQLPQAAPVRQRRPNILSRVLGSA